MSEFTPITTQEDFDKAIGARLQRERETAIKPYADYEEIKTKASGYEKKIADYEKTIGEANAKLTESEKTIADLNAKVQSYAVDATKTRIAIETGLPMELKDRLSGETDDEIRADAEQLCKLFAKQNVAPLASSETNTDEKAAAFRGLAKNL